MDPHRPLLILLMTAAPLLLQGCLGQWARLDSTPAPTHTAAAPATAPPVAAGGALRPAYQEPLAPPKDLWQRLHSGMRLAAHDHPRIAQELRWFRRHPGYAARVSQRARPYLYLVVQAVEARGLPSELALLPVIESAYRPFAYSHGHAAGLWQFVPATGRRFGLKQNWWYDGRRDVLAATEAALDYLEYLHARMDGDWLLALAAYNAGEGRVLGALRRNRASGGGDDYWSLDLPRETEQYVPRLLAVARLFSRPDHYGVNLTEIPNDPFLEVVAVDSQIDLDLAAQLCGISQATLHRYNPGFNRWATDPDGPHRLLVPTGKAAQFRTQLAQRPPEQRVTWQRHRIESGESLGLIAQRYGTTVRLIKQANDLRGSLIHAGDSLTIPMARQALSAYPHPTEERQARTQNARREGKKVEYVVRRGDSLWEIARAHAVGVSQLARWNAMSTKEPLHPGKRLTLYVDLRHPSGAT